MADNVRRPLGWKEAAAAAVVLLVYSICLYRLPTQTFWSPDEGGKFLQAATLRWNNGIELVLPYAGERLDPQLSFYAYRPYGDHDTFIFPVRGPDGQFRFHWPLWFSYVVKLPTLAFGPAGGYLVAMIAGWLVAIIAGLLAREIDADLAAPTVLVVGLSTPIWFYSLCFWEHTTAVALALTAVYALVRSNVSPRSCLLASVLTVGAVMMRIEMMTFVAAMMAVLALVALSRMVPHRSAHQLPEDVRGQRLGPLMWIIVVLSAVALVSLPGVSLSGRHQELLTTIPDRLSRLPRVWQALGGILASPFWTGGPPLSYAGARAGLLALIVCAVAPLFRRPWIEGGLTVVGVMMFALYSGSLAWASGWYRSLHGLFPVAPLTILAAHGLREGWSRRRSELSILSLLGVAYLVAGVVGLGIVYVNEEGSMSLGLAWGQRYLLLLYPLFSVLSLIGIQAYWRSTRPRVLRITVVSLALVLIGIGVKFETRGFEESRRTRAGMAAWQTAMEADSIIITDIWWLPAALAELYTRKPIFLVDDRSEVEAWIKSTAGTGVSRFTFVSLGPATLRDFGHSKRKLLLQSRRVVAGIYLTEVSFLPWPRGKADH